MKAVINKLKSDKLTLLVLPAYEDRLVEGGYEDRLIEGGMEYANYKKRLFKRLDKGYWYTRY